MLIKATEKAKLRQTFAQMKHELGALQQQLENAPEQCPDYQFQVSRPSEGFIVDEYILGFRLGNISDLAMHLHEVFKLTKG